MLTTGTPGVCSTDKRFFFRKSQRLPGATDYQNVFDNVDCKQAGKYCTLLSARNNQLESRLGLIAAKRNLRLAVQRNRAKRLLRESFRENSDLLQTLDHRFDVIALIKASAADASSDTIRQELDRQWSKLVAKRMKLS